MKKNKFGFVFFILQLLSFPSIAEEGKFVLTKDNMLSILKMYHPLVKQAELNVKRAQAEVLQSRGAFDPKIGADLESKTFNGKEYYNYFNPELSIPVWYGFNIKTGLEQLSGANTTPEMTFGQSSYLGIQLNTNQLIFDKRRALLRQASLYSQLSEAEQQLTVNELLFEALKTYWNWAKEYNVYQILEESAKLNEDRFRFVKIEYEQGNRPAIDTIEALAQLQNIYFLLKNAELSFKKAGFELSNYLWYEDNIPFVWTDQIIPSGVDSINQDSLPSLISYLDQAKTFHPKLRSLGFKIDVLEIERRLKFQSLLPDFGVQANLLNKGFEIPNDFSRNFYTNNNKVALSLNVPLFFRSARGGYNAAKFKLQQGKLEQNYTALEIENKVRSYYFEVNSIADQIKIYEAVYENNRKLLSGENVRLQVGESTLFILNSRENKLLEVAQKLQELKAKWHQSIAGLYWSVGNFD